MDVDIGITGLLDGLLKYTTANGNKAFGTGLKFV